MADGRCERNLSFARPSAPRAQTSGSGERATVHIGLLTHRYTALVRGVQSDDFKNDARRKIEILQVEPLVDSVYVAHARG